MASLRKTLSVSIIIAVLFGITVLARMPATAHASTANQISSKATINWENVVAKANPYIHVVNNIATIDPQLNKYLGTNELTLVQQSVTHYNTIPLTFRQHPHLSGSYTPTGVHTNTIVGGYKAYRWRIDTYWWGVRMWINTYAAQNFNNFMIAAGAIIGAIIGNIIGGLAGAVVGAVVGAVSGIAASVVDNECGQRGIFIDINWILQVSLNPVC